MGLGILIMRLRDWLVYSPAMAECNNQDQQLVVIHFIHNPIRPNADEIATAMLHFAQYQQISTTASVPSFW